MRAEMSAQIDVLASLVHPRGECWRNRFVMMEAYFDESGIHDRARICVVAGFYGEQQAWRDFEGRWNQILGNYEVAEFHAKRFYGRNQGKRIDFYKNWEDTKAAQFLEELADCIVSSKQIFPLAYSVVVNDFLALPLEGRRWYTGAKFSQRGRFIGGGCPSKPYYLPFMFCALKSAQNSITPPDKMHLFVGLDRTFQGYASELFRFLLIDDRLPESLRSAFGTLVNPLAKDTPGLQAADLIAYTMYQASLAALDDAGNYHPPEFLMRLVQNWQGEATLKLMNAEWFSKMNEKAAEEYRRIALE